MRSRVSPETEARSHAASRVGEVQAVAAVEVGHVQVPVLQPFDAQVMRRHERVVDDHVVVVGTADGGGQARQCDAMRHFAGTAEHLDVDQFVHLIASR